MQRGARRSKSGRRPQPGDSSCKTPPKRKPASGQVLRAAAQAEGERRQAALLEEAAQEEARLEQLAQRRQAQAIKAVQKIVLERGR